MKKFDVVIAGSGLGGLECGYILSKMGYNVCVLEKNAQAGGCLQTFSRGGTYFDTGFHYVGALGEGEYLNKLFGYFGLLGLPWHKMDEDGFAEVVLDGKSYLMANGFDRFADTLAKDFPKQRKELENYTLFLRRVGNGTGNSFKPEGIAEKPPLFESPAREYIGRVFGDPLLRNVVSGASMTMELCSELPLYTFAQINSSFIQSAWRLRGGGEQIADKLVESIRQAGGTVRTKAEVTKFVEAGGEITDVEVNGEELIGADHVISDLHPALTLSLIPEENSSMRKIYRRRITALPNTCGMFTVHLKLKENSIPYLNRNIFIHKEPNLWDCKYRPGQKVSSALVSCQVPQEGSFTPNIDILTPMHWEEVEQWADTAVGKRGGSYEEFKGKKAEECIALASERIGGLKGTVEKVYTSSPLTYRDYTGTVHGSAYGIRKDCNNTMQTILSPRTPVKNLFMTGQNLNLHGILGVSMSSVLTCGAIAGMDKTVGELEL